MVGDITEGVPVFRHWNSNNKIAWHQNRFTLRRGTKESNATRSQTYPTAVFASIISLHFDSLIDAENLQDTAIAQKEYLLAN